jgi:hypothetical protein
MINIVLIIVIIVIMFGFCKMIKKMFKGHPLKSLTEALENQGPRRIIFVKHNDESTPKCLVPLYLYLHDKPNASDLAEAGILSTTRNYLYLGFEDEYSTEPPPLESPPLGSEPQKKKQFLMVIALILECNFRI